MTIGFGSWLLASSVPTLACMALLPFFLYKILSPEITATPEAPLAARRALEAMGPMSGEEKTVAATFIGMVALWGLAATLHLDSTAIAFNENQATQNPKGWESETICACPFSSPVRCFIHHATNLESLSVFGTDVL